MTSSYSKTSVCVRPHVNEKPAFFKVSTLGTVLKRTPFTCGRQAKTEKKSLVLQNIRIRVVAVLF